MHGINVGEHAADVELSARDLEKEELQSDKTICYEWYESLSPLSPAVRKAYEENRRREREEEAKQPEVSVEQDAAMFQGTKALKVFAAAGSAVSVLPVLFCAVFFVLFCRDFISAKGLSGALAEAGILFIYYSLELLMTIGVGSILGVVMAWVRLRRVPVLHVVLAAVMSFVGKIPIPLCVLLPGAVCYTLGYHKGESWFFVPVIIMFCIMGVIGGVYTGDAFYRRGKERAFEWKEPVALSEFVRFLWRRGTPDFGRAARRLYYGMLIATGFFIRNAQFWFYENSAHHEEIWKFLRTGSVEDGSFTIFFLGFIAGLEFLFSSLAGLLRRRCLIQREEG